MDGADAGIGESTVLTYTWAILEAKIKLFECFQVRIAIGLKMRAGRRDCDTFCDWWFLSFFGLFVTARYFIRHLRPHNQTSSISENFASDRQEYCNCKQVSSSLYLDLVRRRT